MLPLRHIYVGLVLVTLVQGKSYLAPPNHVEHFTSHMDPFIFDTNTTMIWSPVSVFASLVPFLNTVSEPTLFQLKHLLGINNPKNFKLGLNIQQSSLTMCSALFAHKDLKLKKNFSKDFNTVETFDNAINLMEIINDWVKNATNGQIPSVVNGVNENAQLILVNGVAFKSTWKEKFRKKKTLVKPFHGVKGDTQVEMMLQKSVQNYGVFTTNTAQEFQMVKMSYKESLMHVIFVLPENAEDLSSVFKYLTQFETGKLSELLQRLEPAELEILVPKMRVSSRVGVQKALEQAGLESLFSPVSSNLSIEDNNSTTTASLHVDQFVHETAFELDEDGTKAGAATASVIVPLSGISPTTFSLDRPFILFLRWEGRWNFFEGIVTDLNNTVQVNQTSSDTVDGKASVPVPTNTTKALTNVTRSAAGDWWVHTGPPEYLNEESSNVTTVAGPTKSSNETLDRFQQPEPKDPHGIRFPNPKGNQTIAKLKYLGLGVFHGEHINRDFVSQE